MVNDIVLGHVLRENLQIIQKTQRALDRTTLRLATGLKVNSAIDDPNNFFTSKSLANRSNDLERILNGINRSLRTIEEADNALEGVDFLLRRGETIAQEAVNNGSTNVDGVQLTGNTTITTTTVLTDLAGISTNDRIRVQARDPDTYLAVPSAAFISITAGMTGQDLVDAINGISAATHRVTARIAGNNLIIEGSQSNTLVHIQFYESTAFDPNLSLAEALGFGDLVSNLQGSIISGAGVNEVEVNTTSSNSLTSFSLTDINTGGPATLSTRLTDSRNPLGGVTASGIGAGDTLEIQINDESFVSVALNGTTIGQLIDAINNNLTLSQYINATFIEETGQISIVKTNDDLETINFGLNSNEPVSLFYFGFNFNSLLAIPPFNDFESMRIQGDAVDLLALEELEEEYRNILSQLSQLVLDSEYLGISLLNGEDLTTFFDEKLSSALVTEGKDFSALGLGLNDPNFITIESATRTLEATRDAIDEVRAYVSVLAIQSSIIDSRKEFTQITINTLDAGARDLVIADQNEEGANLLALQTRLQLSTAALALGAQSQQAVNSLFNG